MVLQSGMNALNPVRRIRDHFADIYRAHGHVPKQRWADRSAELLAKVELEPKVLARYPGELSGGMRQRVSIALALSLDPQLVVFDEPTTALDVLVQHAVMDTIVDLQRTEGFTAVLISHDLGIVLEATQRVLVMHEGRIVEDAPSQQVLRSPQDEYTRMLLSHYADPRGETVSLPGFPDRSLRPRPTPPAGGAAVVVEGVSKTYPAPRRGEPEVHAVSDVSFTLEPGPPWPSWGPAVPASRPSPRWSPGWNRRRPAPCGSATSTSAGSSGGRWGRCTAASRWCSRTPTRP